MAHDFKQLLKTATVQKEITITNNAPPPLQMLPITRSSQSGGGGSMHILPAIISGPISRPLSNKQFKGKQRWKKRILIDESLF